MRIPARNLRTVLCTAALAAAMTACGGGGDGSGADEAPPKKAGTDAAALIDKVNRTMSETTFHSSGTTTALGGGTQEMWFDPGEGLRAEGTSEDGKRGEMFCTEDASYMSAPTLAAALEQSGQKVTVPDGLSDTYVETDQMGLDCQAFYKISESGTVDKSDRTKVNGRDTTAIVVKAAGTQDVYHVAADGEPHILQLESTRDGRTSTITYDSFGKEVSVTMPPKQRTIPMDEFLKKTSG